MSFRKRKAVSRSILALYAFISVTFPLAHRDSVPLESGLSLTQVNTYQALGIDDNDFVCPAHNFAQSTTGTPALEERFTAEVAVVLLPIVEHTEYFSTPTKTYSSRAPPQA